MYFEYEGNGFKSDGENSLCTFIPGIPMLKALSPALKSPLPSAGPRSLGRSPRRRLGAIGVMPRQVLFLGGTKMQ
jgi:hypothetical protein